MGQTVIGTRFEPGETAYLAIDGTNIALSAVVDDTGTVVFEVPIPITP